MDKITATDFVNAIETQKAIVATVVICHPCKKEFVENALKEVSPLYVWGERHMPKDRVCVVNDLELKKGIIWAIRQLK